MSIPKKSIPLVKSSEVEANISAWKEVLEEVGKEIIPISDILLRMDVEEEVVRQYSDQLQKRVTDFCTGTYGLKPADPSIFGHGGLAEIVFHEFSGARRMYNSLLSGSSVPITGYRESSPESAYQSLQGLSSELLRQENNTFLPLVLFLLYRQQEMLVKHPSLHRTLPLRAQSDPKHYGEFSAGPGGLLYHSFVDAEGRLLTPSSLANKGRVLKVARSHADLAAAAPNPTFGSHLGRALIYLEAAKVSLKEEMLLQKSSAAAQNAGKILLTGKAEDRSGKIVIDPLERNSLERLGRVYLELAKKGVVLPDEQVTGCYRVLIADTPVNEWNNGYYGYLAQSLLKQGKVSRKIQPLREVLHLLTPLEEWVEKKACSFFLLEKELVEDSWGDDEVMPSSPDSFVRPENIWSMKGEAHALLARYDCRGSLENLVLSIQCYDKAQKRGKERINSYLSFAYLKLGENLLGYEQKMTNNSPLPPLPQGNNVLVLSKGKEPRQAVLQAARTCFEQALAFASFAIDKDNDMSPEIQSKKGMAAFYLARMAMAVGTGAGENAVSSAQKYLQQARESLESIYTSQPETTFTFPLFLLGEMAEFAKAQGISQGWQEPSYYFWEGVGKFKKKQIATFNVLYDRFTWVGIPEGDYGLLKSFFVVKHTTGDDSRQRMVRELEQTRKAEEVYNGELFKVPSALGIIDMEEGSALVLRRMQGQTLAEIFRTEDRETQLKYTGAVVDALAIIHQKTDQLRCTVPSYNPPSLASAFEKKLEYLVKQKRISGNLAGKLQRGMVPVINSMSEGRKVMKKDAHEENWLIDGEGGVVALDWEDKGLTTPEYDLASLLELSPFSPEEKMELCDRYTKAFVEVDATRYWNAAIFRRFTFFYTGVALDISRTNLRPLLEGTLQAVGHIRDINSDFARQHTLEYSVLEQGIQEIIDVL